jgi:isoleucyl-tRNA synthetase
VTLSSFYLDILKDRLYTYPARERPRRSAQTVLFRLAESLCKLMAPVLCFTAEEIWQELESLSGREPWEESSVHAQLFPAPLEVAADAELLERWTRLSELREEIYKALELARAEKRIGTALESCVAVASDSPETLEFLRSFGDDLRFLLIVSGVELVTPDALGAGAFRSENVPGLAVEVRRADGEKCARCWNYTTDVGADAALPTVCARCAANVERILAEASGA